MSGFPIRPTRDAFGPKPENRRPVRDPRKEMDGPTVADLLFWQVSGMGVLSPVAMIYVPVVAAAVDTPNVAHAEAWNPDAGETPPTPSRTSIGLYQIQYAAAYPDKDGIAQTLDLRFALALPQSLGAAGQAMLPGVPTKIDGRTFTFDFYRRDTGAHDDVSFLALFW